MQPTRTQSPPRNSARLFRLLRALAVVTLLLCLVMGIVSGFYHYEYRTWDDDGFSCRYLLLARGRIEAGRTDLFRIMDAGPTHALEFRHDTPLLSRWSAWTSHPIVSLKPYWPAPEMNWDWLVSIPLWIPAAASALFLTPVVIVGHRKRRRTRSGTCLTCGYSLAGIVADRCPECGQPDNNRVRPASASAASRTPRDRSQRAECPR
jgi:hypothetical protein